MTRVMVLVMALVAAGAGRAAAADEPSPWHFEIQPYAWIPGTYGTVKVDRFTLHPDVGPGDVLDALFDGNAFAGAAYLSVGYERWSVFTDSMGGFAKTNVDEDVPTPFCTLRVTAKDKARFVLADFALAYRLGEWALPNRKRPFELGVYAGTRYVHLGNHVTGGVAVVGGKSYSGDATQTVNFADPIIGVRWSLPILDSVTANFRGDIGGFGASSKIDWGLVGDVRWWLSWQPWSARTYLSGGYRVVAFDRSPKSNLDSNLQFRGPLIGLGFVF